MSSLPADGAMEAICFFEPRNGSVFRYEPAAKRLSSLRVFGASHAASTPRAPLTVFNLRAPNKKAMKRGPECI
jgi:hypothetical protein